MHDGIPHPAMTLFHTSSRSKKPFAAELPPDSSMKALISGTSTAVLGRRWTPDEVRPATPVANDEWKGDVCIFRATYSWQPMTQHFLRHFRRQIIDFETDIKLMTSWVYSKITNPP